MMRSKPESEVLVWAVVAVATMSLLGATSAQSTVEECKGTITALTGCLPYASGKAASPTADCCKQTNTTVQHNKDCLCKFIALVHQGSPEISSLGIQEAKLTQLPTACKLSNVSASNCPKLAPSASPGASNLNSTATPAGSGAGLKLQLPSAVQTLILLAIMALLSPHGLGFSN